MEGIRIPLPERIAEPLDIRKGLDISDERMREYEMGFLENLLSYIKTDETLNHFHTRLVYECNNLVKVIDSAQQIHILELEEIIDNFNNATSLDAIAQYDSEFHKRLFAITGDTEFFIWWRLQSKLLSVFLGNFWKAVGSETKTFSELKALHNQIFLSIKDRDKYSAIAAMQKHFALLLFVLLGSMY